MPNYFVFRVDYGNNFPFVYNELKSGRLRQGWGGKGMDVRNSFDVFSTAWENWEIPTENVQEKYNILSRMLQVQNGDFIVIPKVSLEHPVSRRYFTILKSKGSYSFSLPSGINDFGHCFDVETIVSVDYDSSGAAQTISSAFCGYQCSVNRVASDAVMDAIDLIVSNSSASPVSTTRLGLLSAETFDARDLYLNELVRNAVFAKLNI